MRIEDITVDMSLAEQVNALIIDTSDRLQALEQTIQEQAARIDELESELADLT